MVPTEIREAQWRGLLNEGQRSALVQEGRRVPKTRAEWIIHEIEDCINGYFLALNADGDTTTHYPANYLKAIRKLRKALEPFVRGDVYRELALAFPWLEVDKVLDRHETELMAGPTPALPYKQRLLNVCCRLAGEATRHHSETAFDAWGENGATRFIAEALILARIDIPDPSEHLDRARRLFFLPVGKVKPS